MWASTHLPGCASYCPNGPLLSLPIQKTEVCHRTEARASGRRAARALRERQRVVGFTNLVTDAISKPASSPGDPATDPWAPWHCMPPPTPLTLRLVAVHTPEGSRNEPLHMVTELMQKAIPTPWGWGERTDLSIQHSLGKRGKRLWAVDLTLQGQEEACNMRILPTKNVQCIYRKGLRKPQSPQKGWQEVLLHQSYSVKTGGGDSLSKWEDSNPRQLRGTQKSMETCHHQRNTITFQ